MSWSQALPVRLCPPALAGLLLICTALPPVRADEILAAGAPKVRLLFPLLSGDEFTRILPLAPRATLEQINGESYVLIGEFPDARVAHRLGLSIQKLLRLPFDLAYDPGHPQLDLAWLRDASPALARATGTAAAVQATASAMVAVPAANTANQAAASQVAANPAAADPMPASPLPVLQGASALLGDTPLQIGMASLLSAGLPAAASSLTLASAPGEWRGGSAAPAGLTAQNAGGSAAKITLPAAAASGTPGANGPVLEGSVSRPASGSVPEPVTAEARSADAVPASGGVAAPSSFGAAAPLAAAAGRVVAASPVPAASPAPAARSARTANLVAAPPTAQPTARTVGSQRKVGSARGEGLARTTASAVLLAPVAPAVTTAAVTGLGSGSDGSAMADSIALPAASTATEATASEVIASVAEGRDASWSGPDAAALADGPQELGTGAAARTFLVSRLAPVSNPSVDYLFVVLDNATELEELDGIVPLREVTLYQGRMLARIGIYTRSLRGRLLLEGKISQLRQHQLRLMVARGGELQLLT